MTRRNDQSGTPAQPHLAELLTRYLHRQASVHSAGLGVADTTGEVVPFEAVPVQPVEPRLAWDEAVAVARCFHADKPKQDWQVPADWATIVATQESAAALAFCLGNFPQLVRNLQALLHANDLSELRPNRARPVEAVALDDWASGVAQKRQYPQILLVAGVLRLAGQFDQAEELLQRLRAEVPEEWRAAWANEEAALAWHRGQPQKAVDLWNAQAASVPVNFNRGMAALFMDKPAEARPFLVHAVDGLAEDDAWHHLGRLYLALAEMRR